MKESAAVLFPRFYDERQAASAVRYVAQVDPLLLADGTYFVLEAGGEVVACGGWSRRDRLYTGSGDAADDARVLDPATEPARVRAMFVRADWTGAASGAASSRSARLRREREGFHAARPDGDAARRAALSRLRLQAAREVEVAMPDGVTIAVRHDGEADRRLSANVAIS